MTRRLRAALAVHVKNRKARRARIRQAIAYLEAKVARELEHELHEGLIYGRGPFAMKPGPLWHGSSLADLLRAPCTQVQHPKEPRP